MEAPKKVQIGLKINDYDDWEIQGYSFLEDKQVGMTEYTRTDAFIEKAENFLEMLGYGFIITDNITHTNYDKEQLIEDFEEYLKK